MLRTCRDVRLPGLLVPLGGFELGEAGVGIGSLWQISRDVTWRRGSDESAAV
jgi:hypothetical protein